METAEKGTVAADVCVGGARMARTKKDAKNFTCRFEREIFEKLEEFCNLSGQNKTTVVERAVRKYLDENMELIREVSKKL